MTTNNTRPVTNDMQKIKSHIFRFANIQQLPIIKAENLYVLGQKQSIKTSNIKEDIFRERKHRNYHKFQRWMARQLNACIVQVQNWTDAKCLWVYKLRPMTFTHEDMSFFWSDWSLRQHEAMLIHREKWVYSKARWRLAEEGCNRGNTLGCVWIDLRREREIWWWTATQRSNANSNANRLVCTFRSWN